MPLADWEKRFASSLREMLKDQRGKAGAMLPVIPSRDEWDQFVAEVRNEWWHWEWIFTLALAFSSGVGTLQSTLVLLHNCLPFAKTDQGEAVAHGTN